MVDPWDSPVACSHTPVALPRNSPVPSLPIVSSSSCCMVVSYLRFVGFGGGPGVAEPAGEGIDRRPRVRPRPALPTAARRFPWHAVRLVNGRDCDVVAAVAAEDDTPGWLYGLDFRLQLTLFVHEKPRNKLGVF